MKRLVIMACVLGLLPTAAFAAKAVLLVDGQEVTDVMLESAKRAIKAQARGQQIPDDTLLRMAVNQVIGQALLVSATKEAGIVASDQEVKAAIEAQRKAAGGREALAARLEQAGLTEADIERMEADRLAVQRFLEGSVLATIQVTDDELKSYYDTHPDEFKHKAQIRIRQVLVAVPPNAGAEQREEARAKADTALKRLQSGEAFEKVAADLSDDRSKTHGGEVGWIHEGMLLPGLDSVVFGLADGELSPVLESRNGYHIFRVDGRRGPGTYEFEETKPVLRRMLTQRKGGAAIAAFVSKQKESADVKALDPGLEGVLQSLDGGAAPTP